MNIPRVFIDNKLEINSEISLNDLASLHISRVLRKKEGSQIELFNGLGYSCLAEVISLKNKLTIVKVKSEKVLQEREGITINLALSMLKPSAFDFAIQKCSELGVNEITPILAERSSSKIDAKKQGLKEKRWQIIAQGACEQCGLNWLPRIRKIVNICDWAQSSMLGQKIALIPNAEMKLSEVNLENEINIIIGPEGDFTDFERKVLDYNNFKCTSMGKRILRSETAAISSLSALRTLSGEF